MTQWALIACGALARDVLTLKARYGWPADVVCLPALLHNTPHQIIEAVRAKIHAARAHGQTPLVVYGDCGTGGLLDKMLAHEQVARVRGPHCYEMYAGTDFDTLMAEAPGTYFLTDYLVQSFDHLVIEGLGLDKHRELRDDYFAHYTRCIYLAQTDNSSLHERAHWCADQLGLPLEIRLVGYGALESRLNALFNTASTTPVGFAE